MLAFADWANDDGRSIYPSVNTLAKRLRLSRRQIQRKLAAIKATFYLEDDGQTEYGTKRYLIRIDLLQECPLIYGRQQPSDNLVIKKFGYIDGDKDGVDNDMGVSPKETRKTQFAPKATPNTFTTSSNTSTTQTRSVSIYDYCIPNCLNDYSVEVCVALESAKIEHRRLILDQVEYEVKRGQNSERDEIKDPVSYLQKLTSLSKSGHYRIPNNGEKKSKTIETKINDIEMERSTLNSEITSLRRLSLHNESSSDTDDSLTNQAKRIAQRIDELTHKLIKLRKK